MKLKEKMSGWFKKKEKWMLTFVGMLILATAGVGIYIGIYFTAEKMGEMTQKEAEAIIREELNGEVLSFEREWEFGTPSIIKMTIKTEKNYEDIEMDASNGQILRREAEYVLSSLDSHVAEESSSTIPTVMSNVAEEHSSATPVIMPEEAIELALEKVTGNVKDIELDEENHNMIYEVEIEEGSKEHNVHVDAMSGSILMVDTE